MAGFNLGKALEGAAYGTLNEVLADYRTDDGYALNDRYEVVIHPPTGSKGNENLMNIFAAQMQEKSQDGVARRTGLRCSQIVFPGRTIETAPDANGYGPAREIAQGWSFQELMGTFQMSSDLREKQFFETWQRLTFNPQTWNMGYYDSYVGSIDIYQLDVTNRRRYGVKIVECFPKTMDAIQMDYGTPNTLNTMQVTFSYRYWKSLADEADLPKPLEDRVRNVLGDVVERQIISNIPKVLRRL